MRERTNEVDVERDVKVTVTDGTVLLADVYHPVGIDDAPTILERTPYGRANFASAMGPEFAARGYRYVLQACRGTDGSGGTHSYFAEAGDGRDTADWIASQPWFDGRMGSFGASYMGFTQWALASTKPPHLKAMAVALSTSVRAYSWYPGGSLALEVIIPWDAGATQFNQQADAVPTTDISPEGIERRMAELKAGFDHLPLGDVIQRLTGVDLPLYRDQLAHGSAGDGFWDPVNFRPLLAEWTVPTLLVDGWHDYPLPGVVEDYAVLRASPAPVHLRIGAGGHLGGGGEGGMTDAPLDWFDTWLLGREGILGPTPVKIHVQGEGGGRWRDLPDWPPRAEPTRWYLQAGGGLAPAAPESASEPDRYRYDPADPTPSMGGIGMLTGGTVDNRPLEALSPTSSSIPPTSSPSHSSSSARWRRSCMCVRASTTPTSSSGSATCHPTAGPSTCATGCSASTRHPSAGTPTERSRRRWPCGPSVTSSAPVTGCGSRSRAAPTPSTPAISAPGSRRPRPPPCRPPSRPSTTSQGGHRGSHSRTSRAEVRGPARGSAGPVGPGASVSSAPRAGAGSRRRGT